MTASITDSTQALAEDYIAWMNEIVDCDPSVDEDSLDVFIDLQGEEEAFEARALDLGFDDLDDLAEYAEAMA